MVSLTQPEPNPAVVSQPLVVSPETTVLEAITLMSGACVHGVEAEARSSCVVIVDNHQLVGLLTERDVLRLISQNTVLETLPIREVMSRNVITLRQSAFSDAFDALDLLRRHNIRHLPILDEGDSLVGLVTHASLRQDSRPVDALHLRTGAEVMEADVICADPDSSLLEIAGRMSKHDVGSVVITQPKLGPGPDVRNIPVGIITERDVVQSRALGLDLETCQAQSMMKGPIVSIHPEESLWSVQQMMEHYGVERLVVTGDQGELLGIITENRLLEALNPLELQNLAMALEAKVLRLEAEKIQILKDQTCDLEEQIKQRTATIKANAERENLIAAVSGRILSTLNLSVILDTVITEVQKLMGCERVAVWRFLANGQAIVAAEAIAGSSEIQMGRTIHAPCISEGSAEEFFKDQVRAIDDIKTAGGLSPCRRGLMEQLQSRASVLIPILHDHSVWGLLEAAEQHAPRQWQADDVTLLERLTTQLAIAIQRAEAHQKLQESEQRYSNLAMMSPVGIFQSDTQGRCIFTNEHWQIISGRSNEASQGSGWEQAIHPDDRDRVKTEWYKATQKGVPFGMESRFQRPDGSVRWVYGQAVAERDADGEVIGYIGTVTDITERKVAELKLSELNQNLEVTIDQRTQDVLSREAQLLDLFDNATDLIQSVSPEGRLLFVNRAWKETLGYSDAELINLSIFDIIHPADHAHCKLLMDRLFAGERCLAVEARFLSKSGREITVEGNVNCQFTDGKPVATRGIFRDITARHQAETALRESQQLLQTVLDTVPLSVFWKDGHSKILGCNQRFAKLSGKAYPQECIGKSKADLGFTHEEAGRHQAEDRAVINTGVAKLGVEECSTMADGRKRWVETNRLPLRDLQGAIVGVVGTYQDITARRSAEAALAASEAFNRNLIEEFPIGVACCRMTGEFTYVNSTFCRIVGRSFEEILACTYQDLTPDEYRELEVEQLQLVESTGQLGPYEKEYIHSHGHRVPVLLTGILVRQNHENVMWAAVQEITDRKRFELEIHALSERLKVALKSGAIGCWDWDLNTNTIVWDQRMYELYDVEPSDSALPYDIWRDHVHQDDRSAVEKLLQQAVAAEADYDTEFRIIHSDGSIHFIKAAGLLVRDDDGKALKVVGVNFDISDRKLAEARLQRTNLELARATRLKDEFLANMSHELRTPLNAILGMTEGLKDEIFGKVNSQQIKSLQTIETSGSHLLSLINDILDVAKIESGKIQPDCTSISVAQVCLSSLTFIKELAHKKGIHLKTKFSTEVNTFSGDERLIRQALINLLSNAVKFTPEGGTVTLTAQPLREPKEPGHLHHLRISVEDTGIGIAKKNISKLFKPFVQIDSSLNRQFSGTGLGLSLVKKIVELHGGRVALTSQLGKGSCFTIDLPCQPAPARTIRTPAAAMPIASTATDASPLTAPLILLAEDNEANICTISSYLTAKGFRVLSAKDGKEAIAMASRDNPDLILMDIQMPGMDGLTAIRKLRHDPLFGTIPIIALTALAMDHDRELCLQAGATEYITKPVKLKELTATILHLIEASSKPMSSGHEAIVHG